MKALVGLLGISAGLISICVLDAAELSSYRGLPFGMDLATAAKHIGVEASEATTLHQRPVVIQELGWEPTSRFTSGKTDSIKYGQLGFYKNELYRIVVTYDRDRVEGMTTEDMIAAISMTYGKAMTPKVEVPYRSNYAEVAQVLARWEDSEYSFNLVRSGYGDSFGLVMYSKRLETLAATAIAEAKRLDAKEAPQRAIEAALEQHQQETSALDKARTANAAIFQP